MTAMAMEPDTRPARAGEYAEMLAQAASAAPQAAEQAPSEPAEQAPSQPAEAPPPASLRDAETRIVDAPGENA
jgi:hypothetical protein